MTPFTVNSYFDVTRNRLVSPGLSFVPTTRIGFPRGSWFAWVLHYVNGKDFTLDANGYAPEANRVSLADYIAGTPLLAIKTESDWRNQTDAFAASLSGFLNIPAHNPTAGRVALGGILLNTLAPRYDYVASARLSDGSGNLLVIPRAAVPLTIESQVALGTESGAPPSPILYHGIVVIPEGDDQSAPVEITGLTEDAEVLLQQQNTGNGSTGFQPLRSADTLIITADQVAPVGGWTVVYDVRAL